VNSSSTPIQRSVGSPRPSSWVASAVPGPSKPPARTRADNTAIRRMRFSLERWMILGRDRGHSTASTAPDRAADVPGGLGRDAPGPSPGQSRGRTRSASYNDDPSSGVLSVIDTTPVAPKKSPVPPVTAMSNVPGPSMPLKST
jgi:hypothetical protein